ncbi:MAG TPA: hypothetical protein VIY86_14235, partial [Pirellulaceae bacterium]
LEKLWNARRAEGQVSTLTEEALRDAGITPPARVTTLTTENISESYSHSLGDILDRVRLSTVGRACATDSGESLLVAGYVDPRFRNGARYRNTWQSISKATDGSELLGEPQPYAGAAYVVKVAPLRAYEDLLFVEAHVVFVEPEGWFQGANLLRSKLPPVIQVSVRAFRRDLMKLAQTSGDS